ncbi:MAG: bacterial Ig-like domain-containing protein [Bacteroidaceae bacterium]|nr:bacterial Ig-like domain-containing protein [Bacteroidaceae bacterium]
MTQHLLKNSFLRGVLFLLLCVVGMGNAWGEEYKLITSTSELVAGEKYIIASMADGSGFVMTNYESGGNNWKAVAATTTSSTITFQNGMATLTLGGSSNAWTFHNGTYYMDATATTSSNYLKGSSDVDKYNKFSISFSNDAAVITCTGKNSRNILRYNTTSKLFACYSSGQASVYLYKKVEESGSTSTITGLTISGTASNTTYYVGDTPSAEGLGVIATYNDESTKDVTSSVSWSFEPATIQSNTNSVTATASYGGITASTTYNITVKSIANTAESAYTVAQACAYIDAGKGLSEEVYVKGIVSQVDNFNDEYGSITYWISDDGTTTSQQFQCYGGLDIDGTQFTSIDDLKLGTVVVVKGLLKKYNATYEFDKNNVLISKDESNAITLTSIEISGTPAKTSYYVGDTPSAEGLVVTAAYSDDSEIEVTDDVTWTFNPETITEETTQITATASYRGKDTDKTFDVTVASAPIEYTYTLDLTTKTYYEATNSSVKWNTVVANMTLSKGSSSTTANNYIGGSTNNNNQCTHTRIYKNQILTISPKAKLIKVVFTATSNDYANNVLYYENAIATVDGVYINVFPEDGNCDIKITPGEATRFTQMVIHYQPTTVEISSAGLATFCLPYNATIPDGLTAYTATDNGESVKLTAKEGGKIAAGEGVVLKGEEGTYTFVATTEDISATEGNQMVGVTEDTPLTSSDNAYMLTRKKDDGSIAFRLLATDYTLGANKAYLKLENNARNLISVVWDENATGIYDLSEKEETGNGAIYNLAGQKLTKPQKGINIVNGKLLIH